MCVFESELQTTKCECWSGACAWQNGAQGVCVSVCVCEYGCMCVSV